MHRWQSLVSHHRAAGADQMLEAIDRQLSTGQVHQGGLPLEACDSRSMVVKDCHGWIHGWSLVTVMMIFFGEA